MSEGMVKCCGTPMFLKKTFGAGYHLRISKNENFKKERVLTIVRNYMPNADIKSEINSEIIYSLENEDQNKTSTKTPNTSSVLAHLFGDLELRKIELNINSCGLTFTTMEDVFLRVGIEFNDNEIVTENVKNGSTISVEDRLFKTIPKINGWLLSCQQFKALLLKRFHYAKRYWPMVVMQTVLPTILFMCTLLVDNALKNVLASSLVDRDLDLRSNYGNTKGFVRFESLDLENKFKEKYLKCAGSEGVSTEVITGNPDNWTIDGKKDLDISTYNQMYLIGAEINTNANGLHLVPWYNKEASHTLPASINIVYKSLLNYLLPEKEASISVHNHPVPFEMNSIRFSVDAVALTLIITCLLFVPLTVPFIGASYVLFPIHERVSNSKLLQQMTGLSTLIFWSSSYLFDIINHLLATIILFFVFLIFDFNKVFSGTGMLSMYEIICLLI